MEPARHHETKVISDRDMEAAYGKCLTCSWVGRPFERIQDARVDAEEHVMQMMHADDREES